MKVKINRNKIIEIETDTENETKFLLNALLTIIFGIVFINIFFLD